jgi:hypothetical protein
MRSLLLLAPALCAIAAASDWRVDVTQITHGPKHHFFGYIGHVQNIAYNGNGRYIVCLRTGFHERMPTAADAADIVLIDTRTDNAEIKIEETRAWNPQQGTMFYWNPQAPDTQLIFNDRDPKTNHVFAVLYDIEKRRRIREYRFADTPVGNSGVNQKGGQFAAISYGRLANLRPVTGYSEAHDWTKGDPTPRNDGVFLVDIATGRKRLLVSFHRLADALREAGQYVEGRPLFINHTLWNRDGDRIFFFVRGDFAKPQGERTNAPCTIRPDGTGLVVHKAFWGGHPEWESGSRMIGAIDGRQAIYDVDKQQVVGQIGTPEILPDPEGDVALSPDGNWFVNGARDGPHSVYTILRRGDGSHARQSGFPHLGFTKGDLRLDPAPTWNRTSDAVLVPAFAPDKTRQLFLIQIRPAR